MKQEKEQACHTHADKNVSFAHMRVLREAVERTSQSQGMKGNEENDRTADKVAVKVGCTVDGAK